MPRKKSAPVFDSDTVSALAAFAALPQSVREPARQMMDDQGPPEYLDISKTWVDEIRLPDRKYVEVYTSCENGKWKTEVPKSAAAFHDILHAYMLAYIIEEAGLKLPEPDAKKAAKAAPAVRETELTYKEPLGVIVSTRLGRTLSSDELSGIRIIERMFKNKHSSVGEGDLKALSGKKGGWSYMYYTAWPEPPETVWQAWLYILHLMRKVKIEPPAFLVEATPQQMVNDLVNEWERRHRLQEWKNFLANPPAVYREEREGHAPMLRVRLKDRTARLERFSPEKNKYVTVDNAMMFGYQSAWREGKLELDAISEAIWLAWLRTQTQGVALRYGDEDCTSVLRALMRAGDLGERFAGPDGTAVRVLTEPARWRVAAPGDTKGDYTWTMESATGERLTDMVAALQGDPSIIVTGDAIMPGPPLGGLEHFMSNENPEVHIPAQALETQQGAGLFDRTRTALPERLAGRIRRVKRRPLLRAEIKPAARGYEGEYLVVDLTTLDDDGRKGGEYTTHGWVKLPAYATKSDEDAILRVDDSALGLARGVVDSLGVQFSYNRQGWERKVGKTFAVEFNQWLEHVPDGLVVELSPELNSLRGPAVQGTLNFDFAESESGIDWFDLRVGLTTDDATLTKEEIALLLKARGGFVRLGAKGWRRLAFQMSEEQEKELADLGLSTADFTGEPQRIHALQLAGSKTARQALPPDRAVAIERRAEDIRTRSTPEVPGELKAELRPYQRDGYHFLSYLTANRFGGILADDMGLGKTVQTLTWLLWLRAVERQKHPVLVVCPKSVAENWAAEAVRFAPSLRTVRLPRGAAGADVKAARASADVVICNYAQLRLLENDFKSKPWHVAILDEAQAIKNPQSQTAITASALIATHRLALSGTPIENRLLDLWSLMNFAMPGVLGNRTAFQRIYDSKSDPLARRRLAARVRPFVLRRTKSEVARDLPDRIEEDIHCELEGVQAKLYQAEIKRARAALLGIKSSKQLDKERFSILTSLLRLRQICCHPALLTGTAADESCKMTALLELLEPLMEEGHKVLVFSQFVEMLEMIRTELETRGWNHLMLTGKTEERGDMVAEFQKSEGASVFLISLKAGGFGLNLTAASYVVLFDPWWNPAVENQAIDRTHRIGQRQKVIAYRLLVKETIEEKIRTLQQKKNAMAVDILGEESFARALTLEDFGFLLG